jgi:NADH-quinone oxidoreductase subunit H
LVNVDLILRTLAGAFAVALVPLLAALFLIWESRKVMARMQGRSGSRRAGAYAGPLALLQTFADAIKVLTKEHTLPLCVDRTLLAVAAMLAVPLAIAPWAVIPLSPSGPQVVDLDIGALYLIAVSSLTPVVVIMMGQASGNRGAEGGAFRAVALMVSYEIPRLLALFVPVLLSGSLSLQAIIRAQQVPYVLVAPLAALVFFVTNVAELGGLPFRVAGADFDGGAVGYTTELSGASFGAFHLAEFIRSFTASVVFSILFLGGWRGPWVDQLPLLGALWLLLKAFLVFNLFLLCWAAVPRLRIDQMLALNWTMLTPLGLGTLIAVALVDRVLATASLIVLWQRVAGFFVANVLLGAVALVALSIAVRRLRSRRTYSAFPTSNGCA